MIWGLGPHVVTTLINKFNLQKYLKPWYFANSCNCHQARSLINPKYIPKGIDHSLLKYYNNLENKYDGSFFIHLWNEFWSRLNLNKNKEYPENSIYQELREKYIYTYKKNKIYTGKICITSRVTYRSFGGGNQFAQNFSEYLHKKNYKVVHNLDHDDIDIIFVMDPRIMTLNKVDLKMVAEYKKKHPNVIVIHRVNDCDKTRPNVTQERSRL